FIDQRRSMAHHPLVEFVRAAVAIVTSNFDRDEMLLLLKTGLGGIAPADVALLENYLCAHGITRRPWDTPWTWVTRNQREEDERPTESDRLRLAQVNQVREKIWQSLHPFVQEISQKPVDIRKEEVGGASVVEASPKRDGGEFVRAVQRLLTSLGV